MSEGLPTQDNSLPVDGLQRIDAIACEFERERAEGRQPRIEDFWLRLPEPERPRLLGELLVVELEYRNKEPESSAREPYQARFPALPDIVTAAWNHVRGAASVPAEVSAASSSSSLITRLRARDPEAWRRLTRIYGPSVYGWARRAGLQHGDVADLVQEVFQAVAQHIDAFRRERRESFPAWLWTIARNKLNDWNTFSSPRTPMPPAVMSWPRSPGQSIPRPSGRAWCLGASITTAANSFLWTTGVPPVCSTRSPASPCTRWRGCGTTSGWWSRRTAITAARRARKSCWATTCCWTTASRRCSRPPNSPSASAGRTTQPKSRSCQVSGWVKRANFTGHAIAEASTTGEEAGIALPAARPTRIRSPS